MSHWLLSTPAPPLAGVDIPPPLSWWLDCYTIVVLAILYLTGAHFIRSEPALARWGIRVGGTVFVGSLLVGLARSDDHSSQSVLQLVGGALFLGGATILAIWHAIPFAAIVLRPLDRWGRRLIWRVRWRLTAHQRREEALRQALYDRQAQLEAMRREKLEKERENRLRSQQERDARRRDEARARVELFYARHAQALAERFPKATFDAYVERYLGDDRPADDVERRGLELLQVMQHQLDHGNPKPKQSPLDELLRTRKEQIDRLDAEELPEEWEGTLKAMLDQQLFDKLQRRLEEES